MSEQFGFALTLVLCAAALHALWNALIKGSADRLLTMGLINLGHAVPGTVMIFRFLPPAAEAWPFLVASTLIHLVYYVFLILAYRWGDLSHVYPIARGVAPVLVALGAQIIAGEVLPVVAWAGILIISFGISLLMIGKRGVHSRPAIIAALLTGLTIAAYTVADGMGVRVSDSALGYIGWLFFLEWIAVIGFLWLRRDVLPVTPLRAYVAGFGGGLVSGLAYGLAIYAKQLTTLGTVSAIRESSVIMAALIGVIWFGERPWRLRLVAAGIVALGVVFLSLAHG